MGTDLRCSLILTRMLSGEPRRRREFVNPICWAVLQAREYDAEIFAHRNLQSAAGFNDRDNGGHPRTCLLASDVDPVLAADCHGAHRVFSRVVTEFQLGMIQKASESAPQLECVFTRFGSGTLG